MPRTIDPRTLYDMLRDGKEMKAYLEWEVALVEQLEKDRSIVFKTF